MSSLDGATCMIVLITLHRTVLFCAPLHVLYMYPVPGTSKLRVPGTVQYRSSSKLLPNAPSPLFSMARPTRGSHINHSMVKTDVSMAARQPPLEPPRRPRSVVDGILRNYLRPPKVQPKQQDYECECLRATLSDLAMHLPGRLGAGAAS